MGNQNFHFCLSILPLFHQLKQLNRDDLRLKIQHGSRHGSWAPVCLIVSVRFKARTQIPWYIPALIPQETLLWDQQDWASVKCMLILLSGQTSRDKIVSVLRPTIPHPGQKIQMLRTNMNHAFRLQFTRAKGFNLDCIFIATVHSTLTRLFSHGTAQGKIRDSHEKS